MTDRIKQPYKSERVTLILNRIMDMEDPYLTKLSDYFDKPIGEIQKYTETMVDKGWLIKQKEGRKSVFKVQFEEIWNHNEWPMLLGNWESLEENTKEFLKFALQYKLMYSFAKGRPSGDINTEEWVKTSETHNETGEHIYVRSTATLADILQENVDIVSTIEALLEELGQEEKRGIDNPFTHERAYVKAYLKMNTGEWNEEELKEFQEKIEKAPYHYV